MTQLQASSFRATRPEPNEHGAWYARYIDRVPDGDVVVALATQFGPTSELLARVPREREQHRYAEGKWSIREVVGHLADTERVFVYRALRFARGDATELPGFDENEWVARSSFDQRSLASLAREWQAVRSATSAFFGSLTEQEWGLGGKANNTFVTARAVAWICAGHELHHVELLRTRYGLS